MSPPKYQNGVAQRLRFYSGAATQHRPTAGSWNATIAREPFTFSELLDLLAEGGFERSPEVVKRAVEEGRVEGIPYDQVLARVDRHLVS